MDAATALAEIRRFELQNLSILKLAAPYFDQEPTSDNDNQNQKENSENEAQHQATDPSILSADLAHYRELFSKLRFSYVEQVTKERFLRAILAQQPEVVDPRDNAALEAKLAGEKQSLKARKEEVRELISELDAQARSLAQRYTSVQEQTARLEALPNEIAELEAKVQDLRQKQPKVDETAPPELRLPLQPTLAVLNKRELELTELDRQIAELQRGIESREMRAEALTNEVDSLRVTREQAEFEAEEARRRKETGGMNDEIDLQARWLRGAEAGLRKLLET